MCVYMCMYMYILKKKSGGRGSEFQVHAQFHSSEKTRHKNVSLCVYVSVFVLVCLCLYKCVCMSVSVCVYV